MSNKEVRIFSAFFLLGITALLFPATALENSIATAQEEDYSDYEENNGYYDEEYYPYEDNTKKDPILKIKKELFVCNEVETSPTGFQCVTQFNNPVPIDDNYIPCTPELCPGIDESDFSVQIFKNVATIRDLTPQGTPLNLEKYHYSVTENEIDDIMDTAFCYSTGFRHSVFFEKELDDNRQVTYDMCVKYVGDCEGTIYPGELKTCTVENYIWSGSITSSATQTSNANTAPTTQSNVTTSNTFSNLAD